MDIEKRLDLIRQVGEEIITEEELKELLETKTHPIAYDGFEPSGTNIHIAQGLLRAININKMTKVGCKFKILVADWHAWANNKMDGNLEHIQKVGKYLIEVWKACDMDLDNVEFIWASELVKDDNYWKTVMQIARNSTVKRITRCSQIMGRSDNEAMQASQVLYPCMQAADIFYLKADICQLGMDQRKVNMLAREVGPKLGYWKPTIISHHMLMGLEEPKPKLSWINGLGDIIKENKEPDKSLRESCNSKNITLEKIKMDIDRYYKSLNNYFKLGNGAVGIIESEFDSLLEMKSKGADISEIKRVWKELSQNYSDFVGKYFESRQTSLKMSKSKPDTAIFMTDSDEDIKRKIKKAYCPEGIIEENPILEYCKYILFEKFKEIKVERPEKWGGNLEFNSYEELIKTFKDKQLHPMDLKQSVSKYLNELLEPIRTKLKNNKTAQKLAEEIKNFKVTR